MIRNSAAHLGARPFTRCDTFNDAPFGALEVLGIADVELVEVLDEIEVAVSYDEALRVAAADQGVLHRLVPPVCTTMLRSGVEPTRIISLRLRVPLPPPMPPMPLSRSVPFI